MKKIQVKGAKKMNKIDETLEQIRKLMVSHEEKMNALMTKDRYKLRACGNEKFIRINAFKVLVVAQDGGKETAYIADVDNYRTAQLAKMLKEIDELVKEYYE